MESGRRRTVLGESCLVVGSAVLATVSAMIAPPVGHPLDALGYTIPVIGSAALFARRRAPDLVVLATTACMAAFNLRGYPGYGAVLPLLVALYTAARAGRRAVGLVPVAALLTATAVRIAVPGGQPVRVVSQDAFLLAGWLVAAIAMGAAYQQWRAYTRQMERRAADAEQTREETARRRAVEERLRIARDLHDSLTHSISVITMQAGVAVHLARKRGEPVPEALSAIQDASRDAVRELRSTLDVLRRDDTTGSGTGDVPGLVKLARAGGVPVTLEMVGDRPALPADVDRAGYRIVQEALTNVRRHAGGAGAAVRVEYRPGLLVIRVDDDGTGDPHRPPVPGMGLIGMRERVVAVGGRLNAAPRPEGGFTVRAELPFTGPPSREPPAAVAEAAIATAVAPGPTGLSAAVPAPTGAVAEPTGVAAVTPAETPPGAP